MFSVVYSILSAVATIFVGSFGEPQCRLMINVLYLIVTVCCTPSTENKWKKTAYTYKNVWHCHRLLYIVAKIRLEWKKDLWFQIFINFSYLFCFISVWRMCMYALSGPILSNSVVYDLFTFWQALSRSVCFEIQIVIENSMDLNTTHKTPTIQKH